MNTLQEREMELQELFEWIEDDTDRYVQIIDYGKQLPPMDEALQVDANLVQGCQSKVWLSHQVKDGKIYYTAESNTAITKGIVAMLVYLWNGLSPREIIQSDLNILEKIKLRQHLTSQRSNGLTAMILQMKKNRRSPCQPMKSKKPS